MKFEELEKKKEMELMTNSLFTVYTAMLFTVYTAMLFTVSHAVSHWSVNGFPLRLLLLNQRRDECL